MVDGLIHSTGIYFIAPSFKHWDRPWVIYSLWEGGRSNLAVERLNRVMWENIMSN